MDQVTDVIKLFKASRAEALPYLPDLHTAEEDFHYFSNIVFKNDQVYLAQEMSSKKILGFIAFNDKFINHLYLLAEAQNMGIGTKLLNVAKKHTNSLKLWTFQKNIKAQNFYLKNGFLIVKKTEGQDNEEKEPDFLFKWSKN